jgi:hypothetical protein
MRGKPRVEERQGRGQIDHPQISGFDQAANFRRIVNEVLICTTRVAHDSA